MAKQVICQFCRKKDDRESMMKVKNKYYHIECRKLIDSREKAINLFYEYTGSLCLKKELYNVFSVIKKQQGLDENDILYLIEYIIDHRCKLNYPMGLRYYVDNAMKDKKLKEKIKLQNQRILNETEKTNFNIDSFKKEHIKEEGDISDLIEI